MLLCLREQMLCWDQILLQLIADGLIAAKGDLSTAGAVHRNAVNN